MFNKATEDSTNKSEYYDIFSFGYIHCSYVVQFIIILTLKSDEEAINALKYITKVTGFSQHLTKVLYSWKLFI